MYRLLNSIEQKIINKTFKIRQTRMSFSGGRILIWYTTSLKQAAYLLARIHWDFFSSNKPHFFQLTISSMHAFCKTRVNTHVFVQPIWRRAVDISNTKTSHYGYVYWTTFDFFSTVKYASPHFNNIQTFSSSCSSRLRSSLSRLRSRLSLFGEILRSYRLKHTRNTFMDRKHAYETIAKK